MILQLLDQHHRQLPKSCKLRISRRRTKGETGTDSAISPLNVPRSRSVTRSDNTVCTEEVIAPAPSPCTAIARRVSELSIKVPVAAKRHQWEKAVRRTSARNQHVHARCRAGNCAS